MAALDFPANPTNGQTYALNGVTYYYNSTVGGWLTQLTSMNLSTSSNTQVLFNDAGLANGSSGLVYNKIAGYLGIGTTTANAYLNIVGNNVPNRGQLSLQPTSASNYAQFTFYDYDNTRTAAIYQTMSDGSLSILNSRTASTIFLNGGSETMRIDSSGRVGIGTTTPGYKLHVEGETFLGRTDSSTEGGQLSFARSSDNSLLYAIDVNGSGSSPEFRLLNQAGGVVFFSAAPAGVNYIKFNPTQMAIGDANVLDDYEEGTFTPTVAPSSGTITSYTASGVYTKIGRVVEVTVSVGITNVGTAAGAYLNVYGLPFTSGSNYFIGVCRENAVNGYLSQVSLGSGATSFAILLYNNNGVLVNGGDYKMSIVYRTS